MILEHINYAIGFQATHIHISPAMTLVFPNIAERPPHYSSSRKAKQNLDTLQSRAPVAVEMPGLHTEHVLIEGHGQGEPTYEDILPHTKEEGAIDLEMNIAYSTATTVSN